jgi:hypothetical protein
MLRFRLEPFHFIAFSLKLRGVSIVLLASQATGPASPGRGSASAADPESRIGGKIARLKVP